MVILEACEGAAPGAFASAAELLAKAGADAVIAHLWPVRADVALMFSTQFYRALTETFHGTGDVVLAANEARRAVLGAYRSVEALSAVVVLRGPDGKIFHFESRDTQVRPSTTLPPIIERMPKDDQGGSEFQKLIQFLLPKPKKGNPSAQGGPHALSLSEIPEHGVDIPKRVSRQILWAPNDIREVHTLSPFSIHRAIAEAPTLRDRQRRGFIRPELCLIFPRDPTPDELQWLDTQPRLKQYASVEIWGMAHLEKLLRPFPAVFARYYPELAAKQLPGFDPSFNFRTFTAHYCAEIIRDKEHVNLLGFPPEALREKDAKAHIRLSDLFVPTVFRAQHDREQRTTLGDLVTKERSVLVLADPGMGKTMLLTFLALLHARGAATLPDYSPPPARIPLFLSLREYALAEQEARKEHNHELTLLDYLVQQCKKKRHLGSVHGAFFEAHLLMGEAIFLLDGLDEVGSSATRKHMTARIRELRREYPDCPVWVTSRIHGYTHDIALPNEEFEHVMIGALDDIQVDDFLDRWYAIQFPNDTQQQSTSKGSLRQAIFRTKQVRVLAKNPLLLTLMAFVHRFLGDLPQDRGELYEQCITMLLRNWLDARERPEKHAFEQLGLDRELPRTYLEDLAFHVQEQGLLVNDEATNARGLFSRADALAFLTTHHKKNEGPRRDISPSKARDEMRDFLDYACDRVGLLADRGGGKLSFLHLSFQEYLAAAHETLLTTFDVQQAIFGQHFRNAAWSEVLLLRFYLFAQKRGAAGRDILDKLVRRMIEGLERADSSVAWLLLARALRDRHALRAEHRRVILERLVRMWATEPVFEGDVFVALEDIQVFAKDDVQADFRKACGQVQATGIPAEAIAALYLEEKLFGGVDGAAKRFAGRADLSDVLADLVAFHDAPELAALLAEKSTADHWETMFSAVDANDVFRLSLGWVTGAVACPVRSDAPMLGAIRWLRRKINAEIASPKVSTDAHAQANYAALFVRPGTVRLEDNQKFHALDAPPGFAVTHAAYGVPLPNRIDGGSSARALARARFSRFAASDAFEIAWNEHAKVYRDHHGKLDGALGALMLAHADYAMVMTGLECENAEQYPIWKTLVDEAGPEKIRNLRHFAPALEPTAAIVPAPAPTPAHEPAPLFTYLHLSDLYFGLPKTSDRHDPSTILTALRDDFATLTKKNLPRPEAIFITGNIAWTGKTADYELAAKWLDEIGKTLGLGPDRFFLVPGNHDTDRSATNDRMSKLLLGALRNGSENLDDVLHDEPSRVVLLRRKEAYLEFAQSFAPACHFLDKPLLERLVWTHSERTPAGLPVRFIAFDTALLAAGNDDAHKLRLGQTQIARLNKTAPGKEFVMVLGHHPLDKTWLHPDDENDLRALLQHRAHVYLAGHGQGHTYSVGAVLPPFDDKPLRLRTHPRRFSVKNGDFRLDVDNVPEGQTYTECELNELKVDLPR